MNRPQISIMVVLTSVILILTLAGFFVRTDAMLGLQQILIRWAVIIAALAVVIGFINLISVHAKRLAQRTPGWFYSLVLILSAVSVLAVGLGQLIFEPQEGLWGRFMAPIFVWVIAPLYAAAAALLPFVLTYAAFRMLRVGRQRGAFVFLISAAVVLIGQLPLSGFTVELAELHAAWLAWFAVPGLRAVLIGVALGIATMALRLMLGIDRPYR